MSIDIGFYRALVLRRLPVMILFFLLISGIGIATAFKLPNEYSTSARLMLEAPQIPVSMIPTTVQTSAAEQLEVIEQRLMTRSNMIDIANRFDVFVNIRDKEPDTVASDMRAATKIVRRSGGLNGATLMTISFKGRSPQVVANVVNEYVTLVMQENSRFRVSRAENTLEFFEQEVERLGVDLSRKAVEIATFKTDNADALPQDRAFRVQLETRLQDRLQNLETELVRARQHLSNLQLRLTVTPVEPEAEDDRGRQLLILKGEIKRLRETYSENNPRIIRLKNRIEQLEVIVAADNSAMDTVNNEENVSEDGVLREIALQEAKERVEALENQIETTKVSLIETQESISETTANSFQLEELERDLGRIQSRYDAAVANFNSAQVSERVEASAQGQRMNVIENANVPRVPSGPNRIGIAAISLFFGIALAVGYFVLLEALNRTVRRPTELSELFDTVPMAVIPYMESRLKRGVRRITMVATTLAVLIGVPLGLWYVDTNYMPLELIVQKSMAKLGLG
ncbi:chain length-determining protein [Sulfitobacter sp. F26169L]|uniref:GumC family protein n=1 Tax=Sulfitobacter sp. F26169L TaxID=2996015 RepID=UPI002260C274|nr:chain length-determining protein [Sulfitobacter sp. F26169L]MCX7567510.1 chain length-determining protein [Sulfitobacter sp. F26169L]